jgi:hypothetical protein
MNCSTFIKLLIWYISLLLVVEFSFSLINESDTLLNIIGGVMLSLFALASYKTNCFTLIKFKKDEEANN